MPTVRLEIRLWLHTWLAFTAGVLPLAVLQSDWQGALVMVLMCGLCACIGSLPALIILLFSLNAISYRNVSFLKKLQYLIFLHFVIALGYGLIGVIVFYSIAPSDFWLPFVAGGAITCVLFACTCASLITNFRKLNIFFKGEYPTVLALLKHVKQILNNKTNINMEPQSMASMPETQTSSSNKILIKGIITGVLILVMLIPTIFISNLVSEREQRQKEVVAEVSNKWANPQTISGPYIVIPYNETSLDEKKKPVVIRKQVFILPETLTVDGIVMPEKRLRSIYTVLLYRSKINAAGSFAPVFPPDIIADNLLLNEARLCIGINDFKGIEEKVSINFNGKLYDLTPGLPSTEIDSAGLSCSAAIIKDDLNKPLAFTFNLKLKGSEQLHFVPLSGNSSFTLQSSWPNPSFDGNSLPTERIVNDKGFTAKWNFNKANLPFSTVIKEFDINKESYSFGVTMLQPADQYAKTSRSVKYAILFIGLTFSLFFIIELLQRKPVHPVQYVLVGLALIIFYSLLLSFSEFMLFNNAYLIAAGATVTLISLYAKGHFASWKVAGLFALVLGLLYGFIFVLIQLEDTALLVGSIGLFIVIALVMYASRKINWYNPTLGKKTI